MSEKRQQRLQEIEDAQRSARMKKQFIAFVAFAVLATGLLTYKSFFSGIESPSELSDEAAGPALGESELNRILSDAKRDTPLTAREQTEQTISQYKKDIEANPESPEAPVHLNAMGNLYLQKLGDYQNAAEQYELLLANYPDWAGARMVYPNLETCYKNLGANAELRRLYREMTEFFGPEEGEYEYAMTQLGLLDVAP